MSRRNKQRPNYRNKQQPKSPHRGSATSTQIKQAISLFQQGNYRHAASLCNGILSKQPEDDSALHLLGTIAAKLGNYIRAEELIQRAVLLNPKNAEYFNSLGNVQWHLGTLDRAIEAYQTALLKNKNLASAHYSLGTLLQIQGKITEAIAHLRQTYRLQPKHAHAYNRLGVILERQGEISEAIQCYRKALMLTPDFKRAHANYSRALLLSGRLKDGWSEYNKSLENPPPQPGPGGVLPYINKTVHIYGDEGVGDEINFASCYPELITAAAECIIHCDKRLKAIFERSFSGARFVGMDKSSPFEIEIKKKPDEVHLRSVFLPQYIRPDFSSFPNHPQYLLPEINRVEKWKSRYKKLGPGIVIGISWRGGAAADTRHARSIPLEQWEPALAINKASFVNLQYDACATELSSLRDLHGVTIHHWDDVDPLLDLNDFFAQVAALDLVISVDNTTVHVAGSIGTPVWTLLPFVPNWRWFLGREDSPWYPMMTLYRQSQPGVWTDVIDRVSNDITDFVNPHQ